MTVHAELTVQEVADRLAIRELIDAYAHCADRRDAKAQMALFTEDSHFVVFMDSTSGEPSQELHRRDELAPVFDNLNSYDVTTHFNGQSTIEVAGHGRAVKATASLIARRWIVAVRGAQVDGGLDRYATLDALTG